MRLVSWWRAERDYSRSAKKSMPWHAWPSRRIIPQGWRATYAQHELDSVTGGRYTPGVTLPAPHSQCQSGRGDA
jgi:hypothetical protein